MALEDGSLLIHPDRYDSLRRQGMGEDELASRRLLRVDPQFMVIAIGLPVPRFPGTTLDPPLRSRFQARAIAPPPAATRKRLLSAIGTASAAAPLAKAVDALDALDAMHAMRAGGAAERAAHPTTCCHARLRDRSFLSQGWPRPSRSHPSPGGWSASYRTRARRRS